jgi:putative SOS response-associated peptidase YedK
LEETVADSMNERFTLSAQLADLTGEFRLDRIEFPYFENDQYEPTGQIPVIRPVGQERCLGGQRWGLMPYWGKSSVRADRATVGDKPYMLTMLAKKRCVIPCSGLLFERQEGKKQFTYRRTYGDKKVFGLAGLYDVWLDSEKKEYPMCTIVSTAAPEEAGESLPLVVHGEAMDQWLDPAYNRIDAVRHLLLSIPAAEFMTEAVF